MKNRINQSGFSLLEVLVTMVVVALGLLGVAGMQLTAIKLADVADGRSRGAVLVTDIVERITSNSSNAASYAVGFGASAGGTTTAAQDIAVWKAGLAARLPGGDGSIAVANDPLCTAGGIGVGYDACTLVTVTVRWDESRTKRPTSGSSNGTVSFRATARI